MNNGGCALSEELKIFLYEGMKSFCVSSRFLLALNDNQEPSLATRGIILPAPNMFRNLDRRDPSTCVSLETLIEMVRVFCAKILVLGSSKFMTCVYNDRSNCGEISTTEKVNCGQEKCRYK